MFVRSKPTRKAWLGDAPGVSEEYRVPHGGGQVAERLPPTCAFGEPRGVGWAVSVAPGLRGQNVQQEG